MGEWEGGWVRGWVVVFRPSRECTTAPLPLQWSCRQKSIRPGTTRSVSEHSGRNTLTAYVCTIYAVSSDYVSEHLLRLPCKFVSLCLKGLTPRRKGEGGKRRTAAPSSSTLPPTQESHNESHTGASRLPDSIVCSDPPSCCYVGRIICMMCCPVYL